MSACSPPYWLQILQGLAVPVVAGVGAWIALQQMFIARTKLQHDLYERRLRVYEATRSFLANIQANGNVLDKETAEFNAATTDAVFLFNRHIAHYLRETICQRALDLQSFEAELKIATEGRQGLVEKSSDRLDWLSEQLQKLPEVFDAFLRLDRRFIERITALFRHTSDE
jgi:hypothetical protein